MLNPSLPAAILLLICLGGFFGAELMAYYLTMVCLEFASMLLAVALFAWWSPSFNAVIGSLIPGHTVIQCALQGMWFIVTGIAGIIAFRGIEYTVDLYLTLSDHQVTGTWTTVQCKPLSPEVQLLQYITGKIKSWYVWVTNYPGK